VLVEGYMDAIAVARAGVANVVASCGTSLTEAQVKLLARFTRRVVVNYDPDTAGQAATERSLVLLLEQGFDARVLRLPGGADPDKFIHEKGAAAYQKLLAEAPAFVDYLIERAMAAAGAELKTAEGKVRAVNALLPFIQKMPDRLLRSEWATRIAQRLGVDEPVLRATMARAAAERRSEVKVSPEVARSSAAKPAERRLIRMLLEGEGFRQRLAADLREAGIHVGLPTEKLFTALIEICAAGERPDPSQVGEMLEQPDRRLFYDILFEPAAEPSWDEAESCIAALRHRRLEAELAEVQRGIESASPGEQLRELLAKKQELRRALEAAAKN
jgi:DNA primase